MKKVLHIAGNLKVGGVSTFIKSLTELNLLNPTGSQTSLIQHDIATIGKEAESKIPVNVKLIRLNNLHRNPIKFWSKVGEIVKNYDIICFHNMNYLIIPYFFLYRKKYFLFQHGMTVGTGILLKREIKQLWYSIIPALMNAKVICSTEFAYNKMVSSGIKIAKKRIMIIPFGIKLTTKVVQEKQKDNGSALVVGSAGILSKIKRFDLLLESLISYKGERRIQLLLAGEGPERKHLEAIINKANTQNVQIKFLGSLTDMEEFYSCLDLFIFPSHNESLGLVVLEALNNGIPVVCFSDLGGSLSYVKNGCNGIIISDGVEGLKKFWIQINNHPALVNELRKNILSTNSELLDIKITRKSIDELVENYSADTEEQKSVNEIVSLSKKPGGTTGLIRVLHFYGEGTIGGGQQRAQFHLLKALSTDNNFSIGCAIFKEEGYYIEKIKELNIPIIPLQVRDGFDLRFRKQIIKQFKEYDIHHHHDPSPNIFLYSLLAGKKVKRVFTRRGGIAQYRFDIKKQLKYIIKKILIKYFFDGYSGNSLNAVRSVQTQYGVKNKKVFTLYNGTDFKDLEPTIPADEIRLLQGIHKDGFVVGTTGRLVDWKRTNLLIRAFSNTNIESKRLLIVGNGPERTNLEKLCEVLKIKDKAVFIGVKEDIGNYLQVMDAFVAASGKEESFGNSVVEAMYFKIPSIIMQDSLGLLEHIVNNETGFVARDEDDLARKLEYISQNKDIVKEIGERASTFVQEKYSYENLVKNLKSFYYSVLSERD